MFNSLILATGDILIALIAVRIGALIRFGAAEFTGETYVVRLTIFCIVIVISSYFAGLYDFKKKATKNELFSRVLLSLIVTFITIPVVGYVFHITLFYRGMYLVSLIVFGVLQYLWHISYRSIIHSPGMACRILILGAGPLAKKIGDLILATKQGYVLEGYINPTGESIQVQTDAPVMNSTSLLKIIKQKKVNKLVVSLSERRGVFPLQEVMSCKFSGVEVVDALTLYEEITEKLLIENTTRSWFIFSKGFKMGYPLKLFKRTVDIVFSIIGLVLALPLLPLFATLIKINSPGPLFFKQIRVGLMETNFMLYKFRTMLNDAEEGCGAVWAQKDDPRITRIGGFLRKMRIDEIPQLYNVLIGDMSIVGPRPERPEFVVNLKEQIPYYSERHFAKPGITGWAQIRYAYGASVEDAMEKLRYDLYYIKNMSPFLDMHIIFETAKVVLSRRGAR